MENISEKINLEEFRDELNSIKEEKYLLKISQEFENDQLKGIKELIKYLKEKIIGYEKQIKGLTDDKVKLQIKINEITHQNLDSKKKYTYNNINLSSLIDINQKLIEQNKELNEQLEIYKNNLDIYKVKSNINNFRNNKNGNSPEVKCTFCEEKKIELIKMIEEKKELISSIASLQKKIDKLIISENIKKEKKKKIEKIKIAEPLPNITHYFIFNNKFMLLDIDKNIWHLRKCIKFKEFKQNYKGKDDVITLIYLTKIKD